MSTQEQPVGAVGNPADLLEKYVMALDEVTARLQRITSALSDAQVPYALVGGQAVALWVASIDPAAVRTTKDVDLLLQRDDLAGARSAAQSAGFEYFETMGVGMFLEVSDPNPRKGVHLCWAGEKIRPQYEHPAPTTDARQNLSGLNVVSVEDLVVMKLQSNRDQDRVHLRDMIDVGLVDRPLLARLSATLAQQLDDLLTEQGK